MLTLNLRYPRNDSKREFKKACGQCLFAFIVLFTLRSVSYCQTISTAAGNGNYGYTGDGGQATSATLKNAEIVTVDVSGDFYISGDGSHTVRKVTVSTGVITTIAGNGTSGNSGDGGAATSAQLNFPMGLAIDASGNIYISDFYNANVRKVDVSTGFISTIAGTGVAGFNGDGQAATATQLYYPFGIAVDGSGNVYISDLKNSRIRKIDASTNLVSTLAGNGTVGFGGDGGVATAAELNYPQIIILDAANNIYIADQENNRVRKVNASTGIITTVAGNGTGGFAGDGGQATVAELFYPTGLAFDGAGNLYIGDQNNKRVREVTASTGIITTIAGTGVSGYSGDGGPATSAKLSYLDGVAVDIYGNIYIGDTGNNRIRKIKNGGAPLPVELISFDATCSNQNVIFKWSTASESNNNYFTVEGSADGISWQVLGTIEGAGNSSVLHNYSFTGQQSYRDVSYYRLKQTDFDGRFKYSEIIALENCSKGASELNIYPNPVSNELIIVFRKNVEPNSISLSDCLGNVFYNANVDATSLIIPMASYSAGIYMLSVIGCDGGVETRKIVKTDR